MPLLDVRSLAVEFVTDDGRIPAVRDVSFSVGEGGCTGIIGETGCGKSVTALTLTELLPPTARVVHGQALFRGQDILGMTSTARKALRGSVIAMVFQDALSALNPVFRIGEQMEDVIVGTGRGGSAVATRKQRVEQITSMLAGVGMASPGERLLQYPHELSGGMRQRVLIAMALLKRPQLVILDEPTTALDVTTEAQIIELIRSIMEEGDKTFLLITHNLSLVAELCDRVAVLYRGHTVEEAPIRDLFRSALHPYTRGLIGSIVTLQTGRGTLRPIRGQVPNPTAIVPGCQFNPRCPEAMPRCLEGTPVLIEVTPGVRCACFLHS